MTEEEKNYLENSKGEKLCENSCMYTFSDITDLNEANNFDLKLFRKGWNGKGMFVVVMPELDLLGADLLSIGDEQPIRVSDRTAKFIGRKTSIKIVPYYAMYPNNGTWVPGWLASQTDLLAKDWGFEKVK